MEIKGNGKIIIVRTTKLFYHGNYFLFFLVAFLLSIYFCVTYSWEGNKSDELKSRICDKHWLEDAHTETEREK